MSPLGNALVAPGGWGEWVESRLSSIAGAGRWRTVRDFDALGHTGLIDGTQVVSFASNDYLGLSHHPEVVDAARAALGRWGAGAGSSRLVVGSRPVHTMLEEALARWKGTERCVVFPSGFAANLGVLTALANRETGIFSDELNHASIIDGCRLARAPTTIYPHRDTEQLAKLLAHASGGRSLIVSDAVFSMDGDAADLPGLVRLAERFGALLVVDEAHDVLGNGSIMAEAVSAGLVVRVGTLSKTLGSLGGFVACSAPIADLIVNTARSYIFTTALSPPDAAAALAALGVLGSSAGDELLSRLADHVATLAPGHPSPIVPLVVGNEDDALRAAANLLDRGFLVPAIRPPTVPDGTSRLRVSLSADHTSGQVQGLLTALRNAGLLLR